MAFTPLQEELDGLPDFSVRVSSRARRILFKITPAGKLEVVVPKGFDLHYLPAVMLERRDWIWQAVAKVDQRQQALPQQRRGPFPQEVHLFASGETWQVQYQRDERTGYRRRAETILDIYGDGSKEAAHGALRLWLSAEAKSQLPVMLRQTARECGLSYERVSIRGQKTRWGSCSSRGNINLNYKLMFLPAEMVRYVMVHELCHTLEMNHSHRFWREVEKREPHYRHRESELRQSWRFVPPWVEG